MKLGRQSEAASYQAGIGSGLVSRPSTDKLRDPPAMYRIRKGRTEPLSDFETASEARREDEFRIKGLKKGKPKRPHDLSLRGPNLMSSPRDALARSIAASIRGEKDSLVSATATRRFRQWVIGHLWMLVVLTANMSPRTLTIIPRGWEIPAGQLHSVDPRKLIAQLRKLIDRAGGGQAGGYVVGFIHGEFEPRRGIFVIHVHLVAAGGMLEVMDKLRKSAVVKSARKGLKTDELVSQRLRIDRRMTDLPRPLTYLLKSYWPSRWRGPVGDKGKTRKSRKVQRIAEPHHTEVLSWLDCWQLKDLTLLMNLSVGRDGFVLADRAYAHGDDR